MITTEMLAPISLVHAGNDTQTGPWVYVHGYTKMMADASWNAAITATVKLEGTNAPAEHGPDFQPNPTAVQVFDVVTFTNIAPAAATSTAGAADVYDNVLPKWVRVSSTSSTATAGTITGNLVFKSAS